jgi:hypothetical protein
VDLFCLFSLASPGLLWIFDECTVHDSWGCRSDFVVRVCSRTVLCQAGHRNSLDFKQHQSLAFAVQVPPEDVMSYRYVLFLCTTFSRQDNECNGYHRTHRTSYGTEDGYTVSFGAKHLAVITVLYSRTSSGLESWCGVTQSCDSNPNSL